MRIGPVELVALLVVVVVILLVATVQRRQRPAAEVIEQIFGEPATPQPGPQARLWALSALHEAGVDPDADAVYAIKVLRQAEPRLTLGAATALVDTLNRF